MKPALNRRAMVTFEIICWNERTSQIKWSKYSLYQRIRRNVALLQKTIIREKVWMDQDLDQLSLFEVPDSVFNTDESTQESKKTLQKHKKVAKR